MDTLPIELLLKIFSYLELSDIMCTIPQVCKLWKSVAADQSMVKALEVDEEDQVFYLNLCLRAVKHYKLITHCKFVFRFHRYEDHSNTEIIIPIIQELAQNCSHLLELSISGGNLMVFQEAIEKLLSKCCKIQKLAIDDHSFLSSEFFSKVQSLETFNLYLHIPEYAEKAASALTKSSIRLKEIAIDSGIPFGVRDDCFKIIDHFKSTLKSLHYVYPNETIYDAIAKCCNLEVLNLKIHYLNFETLLDEDWLKITASNKLKMLRIGWIDDMPPEILRQIIVHPNMSNLKVLSLDQGIHDNGITQYLSVIASSCPNLVILEIYSRWKLIPFLWLDVILSRCKKLVILRVTKVDNNPTDLAKIVDFDNLPPDLKIMDIMKSDYNKIAYISDLESVRKLYRNKLFRRMSYSELRSALTGVEPEVFQLAS